MTERTIAEGAERAGAAQPASPFDLHTDDDLIDLIGEYPLAWVSPVAAGAQLPTLLPLLVETDAAGRPVSLLGHMARRNPLCAALAADPRAVILFTGPQAYVSPAHVTDPAWAPTWNYAQIRIEAQIRFEPAGGGAAIQALIDAMEQDIPSGWTTARMGARYAPMERQIIAFRADITRLEARFKLGQDERPDQLQAILDRHPDAALVRWMRRFNAARL